MLTFLHYDADDDRLAWDEVQSNVGANHQKRQDELESLKTQLEAAQKENETLLRLLQDENRPDWCPDCIIEHRKEVILKFQDGVLRCYECGYRYGETL